MTALIQVFTLLILFVTMLLLAYRWLYDHFSVFRRLGIPGPEPTLILGNIREILTKGPFQALLDWHAKFGNTFGYFEGYSPVVVVSDVDMVRQILVKDFFDYFPNRKPYPMAPRKTHALFLARGGKWKRIRNSLTSAFSSAKIKQMSPIINTAVSELIGSMESHREGTPFDIFEHFQRLTLDVIGRSALGLHFTCQKNPNDPYLRNVRNLFEGLAKSKLLPFLTVFPFLCHLLIGVKNVFNLIGLNPVKFLIQGMTDVIRERRARPLKGDYVDLIELMLNAEVTTDSVTDFVNTKRHLTCPDSSGQEERSETQGAESQRPQNKPVHSQGLTEAEIISQSIVFLLAGYETTSTTLAFAAYALVTHPEIQDTVCAEIDRELTLDSEITYETVQSLRYLDMFFSEVCRKYPTAGLVCTREAVRDWSYKGVTIPAGMAVQIHVWGVHHNPDYWEDPYTFDPERFSLERKGSIKPFTYLPFGEGPRNCIGMRFAIMEAKIAIVRILQKFELRACSKTKIPVEFQAHGAINPKPGVVVELVKRFPTAFQKNSP